MNLADSLINSPRSAGDQLQKNSGICFDSVEITELVLGVALFHGFSKMLIALGREPDEMETTIIQTPTAPNIPLKKSFKTSNPMYEILSPAPKLRDRWLDLEETLLNNTSYPIEKLEAARSRISELLPIPHSYAKYYTTSVIEPGSARLADQFFYDVRSFTVEQRNQIINRYGLSGLVDLMICLALYDGAFRIMSILTYREKESE